MVVPSGRIQFVPSSMFRLPSVVLNMTRPAVPAAPLFASENTPMVKNFWDAREKFSHEVAVDEVVTLKSSRSVVFAPSLICN